MKTQCLYVGKNFERSLSFVTEKGENLGYPLHYLHYWIFEGSKLALFFHFHKVELEGIHLGKILHLLEEGIGFKLLQFSKRYLENDNNGEVFIWGMNFTPNEQA